MGLARQAALTSLNIASVFTIYPPKLETYSQSNEHLREYDGFLFLILKEGRKIIKLLGQLPKNTLKPLFFLRICLES